MKKVFLLALLCLIATCGHSFAFVPFLNTAPNYSFLGDVPAQLLNKRYYFYNGSHQTARWIMFKDHLRVEGFDGCYSMLGGFSGNAYESKLKISLGVKRPHDETLKQKVQGDRCLKKTVAWKKDFYSRMTYKFVGGNLELIGKRHYVLKPLKEDADK